ncbi:MAG: DUF1217 domain-containing protein [Tagaea sp.]
MVGSIGSGLPAVVAWQQLEKTGSQQRERWGKQPSVQREIEYAEKFAAKVKNPEEMINDRRFMSFVLSAFGLESEVDKKGLLRKVLMSDLTDVNSYANRMNDARFKELAQRLDLKGSGVDLVKSEATLTSLTLRYKKNEFDKAQGQATPGMREAIYFKENAARMKSPWDVLGDRTMREVVFKVYDLPREVAIQSVESQGAALTRKVDIAKFQDKRWVEKTIQSYLSKIDQEQSESNGNGASMYAGLLTPLFDSGGGALDLLQALSTRR